MAKFRFLLTAVVGLSLLGPLFLLAQQGAAIEPTILPPPEEQVFGQNQYYSVVFDGEGEAAVTAKLVLQNNSKEEISSTVIEVPGTGLRMIRAVQEVYEKEKICRYWDQVCIEQEEQVCLRYERECADWGWQIRRWQPKYYTLEPKAEELSSSVKYSFDLAVALKEQDESSLLLYYKAPEYAKKSRGVFRFLFETVKVPYDVNQVRVAINAQEGFYLKGGKAETEYRAEYGGAFEAMAPKAAGVESQALQSFSQQVGYISGYVKTTSGLDPWESFKVEGEYAKSRFLLYLWQIIGWSLGGLAFLAALLGLAWFLVKRSKRRARGQVAGPAEHLLPLKIIGAGFGSAVGIILAVILGVLLGRVLLANLYYQYASLVGLLLVLVVAIVVLALLFGPSLYFGLRYGPGKGFGLLAVTIVSLIVLVILVVLFLGFFQGQGGGGIIRSPMEIVD